MKKIIVLLAVLALAGSAFAVNSPVNVTLNITKFATIGAPDSWDIVLNSGEACIVDHPFYFTVTANYAGACTFAWANGNLPTGLFSYTPTVEGFEETAFDAASGTDHVVHTTISCNIPAYTDWTDGVKTGTVTCTVAWE